MAIDDDLPEIRSRCGYCNQPSLISGEWWRPAIWTDADGEVPAVGLYTCVSCKRPTVVEFVTMPALEPGEPGTLHPKRYGPAPGYPPVDAPQYAGTVIQGYRDEAWACFSAGRIRAAIIVARSALQALVRRYLPREDWGNFANEMSKLTQRAGEGWRAVAVQVKDFGNSWAHPDPALPSPTSTKEVREALRRMDEVISFTSAMERVEHLQALNL
jgi:hypothetical protein